MALASMSEIFERMARNGQEFWEVVLADDMDERPVKHLRFWILSSKNGKPIFFRIWIRTLVFLCMGRSFRKSFMEMRVVMFFSFR